MPQPFIGITTYGRDDNHTYALPIAYIDAVRRAGGIPILLPPGEPHLSRLLERLDGLILAGGGDIDPAHYNGKQHETIYMLDAARDYSELAIVQHVLTTCMPTLGICRGAQVINVALGGTLIEHLPDEVGDDIAHRAPPRGLTHHPVMIEPGSRLAEIVAAEQVDIVSWHHQAIRQAGSGLTVVARAADGTIEAAELRTHPWLIAVQWHPELSAATDPTQQRLFDALVEAASQQKRD